MNTTINTLKNVFGLGLVLALSTKPLMAADAYTAVTKDGDTLNYKTSYEVPVNSPDLIPYAHLEMAAGVKKLPNGQFQFCYHLPWEIVSKSDKVPGMWMPILMMSKASIPLGLAPSERRNLAVISFTMI